MAKLRLPEIIPHKPHPRQAAFLLCDDLEAFYGGAAGGGKSDALLMAALQYIDIPEYSAMLLRRSYTDLALPGALMDRAHQWLKPYKASVRWDRETHTFHFPSGASLSFGYIATPSDKWRYQSAELQFIGWDEVTEFPDDDAYTFMFSRLRKLEGSNVPLRVRSASNPVGQGAYWVKKRFVDEGKEKKGIFIPAFFKDNPHLDHESYFRSLQELPESTQKRLIAGSWDEVEDAAFTEFREDLHTIPPMAAPLGWRRWEAMDFGVSNPTAWLTAGLSPEGIVVVYGEYYSPGLISSTSSAILSLRNNSWGQPDIAVCDPSIKNQTGFGAPGRGETVWSEFSKNGIYLVPANNDRIAGRVRIAELLRPDPSLLFPDWFPDPDKRGLPGCPRLFFSSSCVNVIEQIKLAPVDEVGGETVDPYWEGRHGHACAALRYLCTAKVFPRDVVSSLKEVGIRSLSNRWKPWSEWVPA